MPIRIRTLLAALAVTFGACLAVAAPASAQFHIQKFAIGATYQNGSPDLQAGSHPYALTTTFILPTHFVNGRSLLEGELKNATVQLPPGLVGDPTATPRCSDQDFVGAEGGGTLNCPDDTAVGVATTYLTEQAGETGNSTVPVYNLVPPPGVAAEFGYIVARTTPVLLLTSVRTGTDYGLTTIAPDVNQAAAVQASKVTIWGVPASASHDPLRGLCERDEGGTAAPLETPGRGLRDGEDEREGPDYPQGAESESGMPESRGSCPDQEPERPLLTNPTSCGVSRTASFAADTWEESSVTQEAQASMPALAGCEQLDFKPTITATPQREAASSPTGLDVDVKVPQEGTESPTGSAEAAVKDTSVTLPAGMSLNPSAADGLGACSEGQAGFERFEELSSQPGVQTPIFTPGAMECPESSKLADVKIKSPDLEGELEGAMYLASPQNVLGGALENPFASLVALYLFAEEPKTGVLVKLTGKVTLNETTGQVTTSFEDTPQLPFSDLQLEFFAGERASLATPAACGTYTTTASFTPWSGTAPVSSSSHFNITSGPGGTPCAGSGFAPSMSLGSSSVTAGAFTPFDGSVSREDGQQAFSRVSVTAPPGVAAILTGVPECPEAQANAGTCGPESQVAEFSTEVGVGKDPYLVTGGKAYLTGPYDGAPFGASIVTPAIAGPFNLGNVVVRAKIEINPVTAQVTLTTTEIPHILRGIPFDIKRINFSINRPNFTFNPTSCEPMAFNGTAFSDEGATASLTTPFQLADCANLKYEPKATAATGGHSSRSLGASLKFKIAYPTGALGKQAWFDEAKITIPKQLPARLTTIQKACTLQIFTTERQNCPPGSKIGTAVVHTPVLPVPLEGPVYFVSNAGLAFPNVVMDLSGDNVHVELTGETLITGKTGHSITTATFRNTPDVPFESIEVSLPEGQYSEFGTNLPNQSYDFCGRKLTIPTFFKAQNGVTASTETPVTITGCGKAATLTTAQKRAKALAVCRKKHGKARASCERAARKKYPVKKASKSSRHVKR